MSFEYRTIDNFGIGIRGDTSFLPRKVNQDGYVIMRHGENYKLLLRNDSNYHTDARITIDGEHIGTLYIRPHQTTSIERPINGESKKFTFFKTNTSQGRKAGLKGNSSDTGLITVQFRYGHLKQYTTTYAQRGLLEEEDCDDDIHAFGMFDGARENLPRPKTRNFSSNSINACSIQQQSFVSGGTGLQGRSNQSFVSAPEVEYCDNGGVTVSIRLVGKENDFKDPNEITSLKSGLMAVPRATSVPPPIRVKND